MNIGILIALFLFGLICVVFFVFISIQRQNSSRRQMQSEGIALICQLRLLLELAQKHRGMTTGVLNGDNALKSDVSGLQSKLHELFGGLKSLEQKLLNTDYWEDIVSQWENISAHYETCSTSANFEVHVKWIKNILYLIEDIAETHDLLRIKKLAKYRGDFLWRDWLQSIEYMGQARALGTGVAASGTFSSVDKIRARYLHDRLDKAMQVFTEMALLPQESKANIAMFLRYLSVELYERPIKVSSQHFFQVGTQAMDCLYKSFEQAINEISK